MSGKQCPRTLVSTQFVHLLPHPASQEHGMPGDTAVAGGGVDGADYARRRGKEGCCHRIDERRRDARLITQQNGGGRGVGTRRAQAGTQRRALALGVLGVHNQPNSRRAFDRCANLRCSVAKDDDDLVEA